MAGMVYRKSKLATRLLYKVRHHKGHGVHSPFVFNLINKVIEEKLHFYSYGDLASYLSQFEDKRMQPKKDNLLAFRLVNYFNPKSILELGSDMGVNTLYLKAVAKDTQCICIESDNKKREIAHRLCKGYNTEVTFCESLQDISRPQFDCIYINLNNLPDITPSDLEELVAKCHPNSFIMVKGIRKNKKQNRLWKCLTQNEKRTAELDLFNIGLLFFDKQLYRWRYQISF